jgi:hypothetical protein
MAVLYLLLVAAAYGSCCAVYDIFQFSMNTNSARPDFLPPQEGATVKAPKTPLSGGSAAEAEIEIDGNAVSQVP